MLVLLKTLYKWLFLFSTVSAPWCGWELEVGGHLEEDVDGVGGEAAVLYCTVLYCTVLYCTHLEQDVDGVGGEAAVRQVQHPHQRSPAAQQHSAGIQMFNLFIAWHGTNFPGISHHKKNDFTIHI